MRSLQIGNSVRQSKLNSGGFATEEELHFSGQDRGGGGDGKADGDPHGRREDKAELLTNGSSVSYEK